jgi:hypothetical protein
MVMVKAIINSERAVDARPKNFLTEAGIEGFLKAARKGPHASRNYAIMQYDTKPANCVIVDGLQFLPIGICRKICNLETRLP